MGKGGTGSACEQKRKGIKRSLLQRCLERRARQILECWGGGGKG